MNRDGAREPDRTAAQWRRREGRAATGRTLRWSIAVLCWVIFFVFARSVALFVFTAWIAVVGCVLVAPEMASWLSRPLEGLLWPFRVGKRKPSYGAPQTLVAKGEFERALSEYESIAEEFPGEVEPHIRMLTVAIADMGSTERAEQVLQKGLLQLERDEDREALSAAYDELRCEAERRRHGERRIIAVEEDEGPGGKEA